MKFSIIFRNLNKVIDFKGEAKIIAFNKKFYTKGRNELTKSFSNKSQVDFDIAGKGEYVVILGISLIRKFLFFFKRHYQIKIRGLYTIKGEDSKIYFDLLKIKSSIYSDNGLFIEFNSKRCAYCGEIYRELTDKFNCKYCNKSHCGEHRIPENHKCTGNPTAPPGGMIEIHSRGGIIVFGK